MASPEHGVRIWQRVYMLGLAHFGSKQYVTVDMPRIPLIITAIGACRVESMALETALGIVSIQVSLKGLRRKRTYKSRADNRYDFSRCP